MSINWSNLLIVGLTSIGATLVVVALFAVGVRLLTNARSAQAKAKTGNGSAAGIDAASRMASYIASAPCASALLYGIYLIVPAFHLSK